jgi:hypothetical protein
MSQLDARPAAAEARSDLKTDADARKRRRRLAALVASAIVQRLR